MPRFFASLLLVVAVSAQGSAQTYTWQQPVTGGDWNTAANWLDPVNAAAIPVSSATTQLVFNASGTDSYTATNNIGTGTFTLNTITFNNTGTGTITLAPLAVANTLTFAGTTPTINAVAGLSLINTVIAGTAGLTKIGAGTTILTAANTYTGTTNINGGVLQLGNGGTTGSLSTGNIAIGATGTLVFNRSDNITVTNVFSGTGTIIMNGTGTVTQSSNSTGFTGTLIINSGRFATLIASGTHNFNATSIIVNNGGTYQFGAGNDPNLPNTTYVTINTGGTVDWRTGEQFGGFILSGGTLNMTGGPSLQGSTPTIFQSGTLTGTSSIGGVAAINKTTAGIVTITGPSLNNTGGLNIQEGTISTNAGLTATGNLTFGTATTAGTFQFTGATATLAKPIVLNAGGGTLDVTQAATILTYTGAASGAGPFTKAGLGTLALTGNNTFTGGTTISGGTLQIGDGNVTGALAGNVVNNGVLAFNRSDNAAFAGNVSGTGSLVKLAANTQTLTGNLSYTGSTTVSAGVLQLRPFATGSQIAVAGNAGLTVVNGAVPGTLTTGLLNLQTGGATLRFDLNSAGNPASPLMIVTANDGLTLNSSTHNLVVNNLQNFAVGQFPVIDYAGTPITEGFTLGQLPARTIGALVYNTANTSIDLNITGVDSIVWTGTPNADWDIGTAVNVGGNLNWKLSSNGNATNFVNGDAVLFDDTAIGGFNVNLTTTLSPSSLTINNSANAYTLGGTGSITGTTGLSKLGTNSATLLTDNTYTGTTTISAGTLQLGNGGTTGSIGTGELVNNGALVVNRSNDLTLAMNIGGTGSLTKNGTNILTITGLYTATGNTVLDGGTLALTAANPYTYASAISGAGGVQKNGPATATFTGTNTYTGPTNVTAGTLQIGNGGTAGSITGSVTLGTNAVLAFNRSDTVTFAGDIAGDGGRLSQLGTGTTILTGTLSYTGPTNVTAGTLQIGNGVATGPTFPGVLNVAVGASAVINVTTAPAISPLLTGGGTITKLDATTLDLTGSSTAFVGTLNINGGTVILSGTGAINASLIAVNNGGTFQFGPGSDPNLPNTTNIDINTGGTVEWQVGEALGATNILGGTLILNGGAPGSGTVPNSLTSGTISGVTATALGGGTMVKTTAGTITVTGLATISAAIDIREGTVAFASAGNLGSGAITLGTATTAGTLQYQGATATRGGTITLNGAGEIRVTDPAAVLSLSGTVTGSGSITKTGAGTLSFNGPTTYTGATTVSAGTLRLTTNTTLRPYTLNDSAAITFANSDPAVSFAMSTFTLNGPGSKTLTFELNGAAPTGTQSIVNVADANGLTANGTTSVNIGGTANLTVGQFPLIKYNGTLGGTGSFAVGNLPFRTVGSILNNAVNSSIDLSITAIDYIKWNGNVAGGVWDIDTTPNFRLNSNNAPSGYMQSGSSVDSPRFDDSASGTTIVQLNTAVAPNGVRFENSTLAYTLQGTGSITGATFLSKTGTGLVKIATDNTYTGGTTVSAGTLQIGDAGTTGSIAGAITLAGGTLQYNRTDTPTFTNAFSGSGTIANIGGDVGLTTAIPVGTGGLTFGGTGNFNVSVVNGTGTLTKTGTGTLTLYGNSNGFTGTVNVNAGKLILTDTAGSPFGAGGDLGASTININNGGTFQFGQGGITGENPDLPDTTVVNINNGGTFEIRIGENFNSNNLLGGTLFYNGGGSNSGTNVSTFTGGTFTSTTAIAFAGPVVKTTAGIVTVTGSASFGGTLAIEDGTVVLTAAANLGSAAVSLGSPTTTGTLEYQGATATRAGVFTFAGPGEIKVTNAAAELSLTAVAAGSGTLTKTGPGTLALNGANTNTGAITVAAGTLAGTGTLVAPVTVQTGARIAGGTAASLTGTLTTANVTVANGGILNANLAASGTNSTLALGTNTLDLATGSRLALVGLPGFDPLASGSYILATTTGGNLKLDGGASSVPDGFIYGQLVVGSPQTSPVFIDTANFGSTFATGDQFVLSRSGDNLVLNYAAVPEPSLLLGLGVMGLGGMRWLRRRGRAC
jgi:autotransporter-associated beta strand protein